MSSTTTDPDDPGEWDDGTQAIAICDACGKPLPIGGWPFCASERNPEGHSKGTYRWGLKTGMAKWNRMSK